MKTRTIIAAALALALPAAPVAAAAAPAAAVAEPTAETVEGEALYRSGILVPIAAVVALALIIYLVIGSGGDDEPASP